MTTKYIISNLFLFSNAFLFSSQMLCRLGDFLTYVALIAAFLL